jgi:hypothetical protein
MGLGSRGAGGEVRDKSKSCRVVKWHAASLMVGKLLLKHIPSDGFCQSVISLLSSDVDFVQT